MILCGSNTSTKLLYLTQLRKWKQIVFFAFLAKIRNGHHFWEEELFFENWQEYISKIPL